MQFNGRRYYLLQLHMHTPSEHQINGKVFDGLTGCRQRGLETVHRHKTVVQCAARPNLTDTGCRYNHGGGYQYRLWPASEPLTEECFQKIPLAFDTTKQVLILHNGSRYPIGGTWVSEGTWPNGSTWAMNPIPRINPPGSPSTWGEPSWDTGCKQISDADCRQIPPPCPDPIWEKLAPASRAADTQVMSAESGAILC